MDSPTQPILRRVLYLSLVLSLIIAFNELPAQDRGNLLIENITIIDVRKGESVSNQNVLILADKISGPYYSAAGSNKELILHAEGTV